MAEYIERESLAKDGWYLQRHINGDGYACVESMNILDVPAADVRPVVRGEWEEVEVIENDDRAFDMIASMRCNKCNRYHNEVYHYGRPTEMAHFCPNCGAMMGNLSKAEHDKEQREYEAAVEATQYCEMYEPTYDPETGAM